MRAEPPGHQTFLTSVNLMLSHWILILGHTYLDFPAKIKCSKIQIYLIFLKIFLDSTFFYL